MNSRRDAYVEKMKAKLDVWNKKIDELESSARQIEAGTKAELEKQLQAAKARRDELVAGIESLRKASDTAWKELRGGLKASRTALDKAVRAAAASFKQAPPKGTSSGTE